MIAVACQILKAFLDCGPDFVEEEIERADTQAITENGQETAFQCAVGLFGTSSEQKHGARRVGQPAAQSADTARDCCGGHLCQMTRRFRGSLSNFTNTSQDRGSRQFRKRDSDLCDTFCQSFEYASKKRYALSGFFRVRPLLFQFAVHAAQCLF